MEDWIQWLPGVFLGIGLSASSGFRVFIPLLISNLAVKFQTFEVQRDMEWIGSNTATIILAVACLLEVGAYYITYVDNLLDSIALPTSILAGTLLTSQFIQIDEPILRWGLGLIVGGGTAGTIQAGTGLLRLASTKLTGGFGNSIVSTGENFISVIGSIIAIWLPILFGVICLILVYYLGKKIFYRKKKSSNIITPR
ncbi:MAG: DUF4126 domain-containing protein [Leadbetterella sp.]